MDNTIKSMFEEKNMKILINKLILDIDNNSNSLELTINFIYNFFHEFII